MTVLGCVDGESLNRLAALFKPLGGQMRLFDDPASAEAVKIIHNCFNATKISFFNEVSAICEAIGLDVQAVAEVVVRSAEAQRNPDYGTVGGRPFGGACLPKDLNGLIEFAQRVDVQPTLLGAVRSVNLSFSTGS
jgi:UDPglucose 6-dehydrogenase